jgi:hypothetical protein
MAKKLKFLATDPAEDVTMPQTEPVEKALQLRFRFVRLMSKVE